MCRTIKNICIDFWFGIFRFLIILVGMPVSLLAFDDIRFHISSKISFLSILEIETEGLRFLFHTRSIASVLIWFLYLTIDLTIRPLILLKIGLHLVNSGILRFDTILENKLFETQTVWVLSKIMLLLSIKRFS